MFQICFLARASYLPYGLRPRGEIFAIARYMITSKARSCRFECSVRGGEAGIHVCKERSEPNAECTFNNAVAQGDTVDGNM